MDTFLAELTNLGAIVRTLILFVVTLFIGKAINRYLSYRSVKSIQRRIKELEAQKLLIDDLATSDRSFWIFSFRMLFLITMFSSLAFIGQSLVSVVQGDPNLKHTFTLGIGTLVCIISWYVIKTLTKVEKYPKAVEVFNLKTESLKERLSKLTE
jgi:hypothetical protein